jgi:hypothetical protein
VNRFFDIHLARAQVRRRRATGAYGSLEQRRRLQAARVGSGAAANARLATHRLLGADLADRSSWNGRPDGTATGVVAGMRFAWDPRAPAGASLSIVRSCRWCGGAWSAPASSEGQVIRSLVEDHCLCRLARARGRDHEAIEA